MHHTKHDLSMDETQLDFLALLDTARIAYAHTRNEIERLLHGSHEPNVNYTKLHLDAHRISQESLQLAVSAETLSTLAGAVTRSKLEIVNKPEVKDE